MPSYFIENASAVPRRNMAYMSAQSTHRHIAISFTTGTPEQSEIYNIADKAHAKGVFVSTMPPGQKLCRLGR